MSETHTRDTFSQNHCASKINTLSSLDSPLQINQQKKFQYRIVNTRRQSLLTPLGQSILCQPLRLSKIQQRNEKKEEQIRNGLQQLSNNICAQKIAKIDSKLQELNSLPKYQHFSFESPTKPSFQNSRTQRLRSKTEHF